MVATLALFLGRVVSTDRPADAVWADSPPVHADKALQTHIQRLRTVLGPGAVETHSDGYALAARVVVDANLFEAEARATGAMTCATRWRAERASRSPSDLGV